MMISRSKASGSVTCGPRRAHSLKPSDGCMASCCANAVPRVSRVAVFEGWENVLRALMYQKRIISKVDWHTVHAHNRGLAGRAHGENEHRGVIKQRLRCFMKESRMTGHLGSVEQRPKTYGWKEETSSS